MEYRLVKKMTIVCGIFTVCVCGLLLLCSAGKLPVQAAAAVADMSGVEMLDYYTRTDEEISSEDNLIKVELPEGTDADDVIIENDYVNCTLCVEVPGIEEAYFYEHPLVGGTAHIKELVYNNTADGSGFEITFDEVFEIETDMEQHAMYIYFLEPREVYDRIVVIDPGHGGSSSPGTVCQNIREADIDLSIALYLQDMFEDSGIGVYLTRTEDVDISLDKRVQLANDTEADLFISIHNNTDDTLKTDSTTGTEVLYNEQDESGKSLALAQLCQEEVTKILGSNPKGVNAGSEIYIIRLSRVPVALIEVGFMSNQNELQQLNSTEYQKKAAEGIYNAIMRALEEGLE